MLFVIKETGIDGGRGTFSLPPGRNILKIPPGKSKITL